MDRYRLQDSEIDKVIEGGGSRVDLGAGSPRPTDRGFSVGIPGLAGFGVKPEMFAEGFFGRESPRDGFTVSQSGGSGKVGATVVGPDGDRFTVGVPLNYLRGEVEFGDELRARGAPKNIKFGTPGIERGPLEGRIESPGGFSASGRYDPRTGKGGVYLDKKYRFEDGGAVGGIGPYLDQLDEPRRFANGGWINMEPARYSGPLRYSAPVFQRQGSFGPGIGGLFGSPVGYAADSFSSEVLADGLTGSGDGGGGGYGDPSSDTGTAEAADIGDFAGYAATALGMGTGLGAVSAVANAVSQATTGKGILGHIADYLGFGGDDAPAAPGMETGHGVGMGTSGYGSDDTGNTGDDAPGPGGNEGAVGGTDDDAAGDDTGGGDGDDGGPGEGDDGGPEGLADGGVAGLSAAREFRDAGTFPDFMAARLGSKDRRDDAVARKLLGGNASPQVLDQASRILNSSSDPIRTFADGGSVRSQRLPPRRPPLLGGVPEVSRRDLIRLADDEFAHTVAPHIEGSPLASAELMMRQTRPGSGGSGTEIPLLSDDLDVRPVTLRRFSGTTLLDQAYRGRLRHLDSGKPLYDSSDFEGRFPIPVHEGLQGLMYGGDRFNSETVDPRVKGVLVNNITDRYGRTQAEASGDTLEGLSDAARANNERVARVSRHELEHAFLTRARNSLSDYIKTTGTDSALGTLLTTNVLGERGRGGKNEHRFLINIYDASSLVDDGRMDPRNQKQLDLYSKMHDLSSGEMKAAVALSETGNVADLPEKYKDSEYQPLVDLVRRAEEEAATQIRSALNSEGYTKAQIDSALGVQDFERRPKTQFVGMDSTGNDDDTKNVLRAEPHFVGMDSTGNDDDTKNPVSRFRRFRDTFRSILGVIN